MALTEEFLKKVAPSLSLAGVKPILDKYEINTPKRIAMFFAQCAHESGGFKYKAENLNYSADALLRVFPRYFKDRDPNEYARNPEKIANVVYNDANRSEKGKLGNTEPGDGWKFRGRGYIQLTGKNNYQKFADWKGCSLDDAVNGCETDAGALESAVYFWDTNNLNRFADADDIVGSTKVINGGTNGLADREEKYNLYKSYLGA